MSDSFEALLQRKQQYLRGTIPEQRQEAFGEFCMAEVGNIDISSWSLQYIEELVAKFSLQWQEYQIEEDNIYGRSSNEYQKPHTKDIEDNEINIQDSSDSILVENIPNQFLPSFQPINSSISMNKLKYEPQEENDIHILTSKDKPLLFPKSATDFFDFAFEDPIPINKSAASNTSFTPRNVNTDKNTFQASYKTQQMIFTNNSEKNSSKSIFDSVNFWAVPTIASNKNDAYVSPYQAQIRETTQSFGYLQHDPFNDFANSPSAQPSIQQIPNIRINSDISKTTTLSHNNFQDFLAISKSNQTAPEQSPYLRKNNTGISGQEKPKPKSQIKIIQIRQLGKPQKLQTQKQSTKVKEQDIAAFRIPFEDTIECFQSNIRMALSDPILSIYIQKHQIIARSFFANNYAMYTLKVLPGDYQCLRNYEDFIRLRNALERVYPGTHLPYLQKNSWVSEANLESIENQKTMLELFIADIILNPQIRTSAIFQDFLVFKEHKRIKRKLQQYDKTQKLLGIEQICRLEGKVDVKLKEEQCIYQQRLSKYLQKMESCLDRQKKLSQTLAQQYQGILMTVGSLQDVAIELQKETKNFNSEVSINKVRNLQKVYSTMKEIYRQSYIQRKLEMDLLNKDILPLLQFEKQNLQPLKQLIYVRNNLTKRYIKRLQYEDPSFTQPYSSVKLAPFKTGVLDQSKNMFVFKYQTGFINNQVCTESQRVLQLMGHKLNKMWSSLSKKHMDRLQRSTDFWKTVQIDLK